jgi:hypothetical protein
LAKVLLLANRDGLSDERAMEAVRFDLRWKVALDLPLDHPGFHPTSLVRFRARLLLHGMERLVFERSLELATELGLLEGEADQIVDSTPMLGAAAVQDTATLVRSGVRRLLDAVAVGDAEAAAELGSGLRFDYSRPREKPEGDWHRWPSRLLGQGDRRSRPRGGRASGVAPATCVALPRPLGSPSSVTARAALAHLFRCQSAAMGWRSRNSAIPRATGSGRWICKR